ncbi:MAG: DUF1801 domain-containing protein [Marinosulfonomonas sp.]
MAENKTKPTPDDVADFLANVAPSRRQQDAMVLDRLFQEVSGFQPQIWGTSIIGYGSYHYTYESGREGDSLATGFSPRKANLVIYIMPGYGDYSDLLVRLGKHKLGKSCLYLNSLKDVDLDVLKAIIRAGLDDLQKKWPIQPS